jgi:hypothetical protein
LTTPPLDRLSYLEGETALDCDHTGDKLASYGAAKKEVMPSVGHRQHKGLNNRAENSHRPTRRRERQMQRFMCGRRLWRKRFFSRDPYRSGCIHVFGLFAQPPWLLALMKSADRLLIKSSRFESA